MAGRQYKDGVDYWNFDVDFLNNKKVRLLRGEYGIKGVYILIYLLNEIYRGKGYYKRWDTDDCLLASDDMGSSGGCSPQLIAEVVKGCVLRSLFDKRVFDVFHVLTSAEIQRRFLRIVGNNRDSISIVKDYFLLDAANPKDVPESILPKIVFLSAENPQKPISLTENAKNLTGNGENLTGNAQRKEENRKEQKRTEQHLAPAHAQEGVQSLVVFYEQGAGTFATPYFTGFLEHFVESLGVKVVKHGIEAAFGAGKTSPRYILAILRRYEHEKLDTLDKVEQSERQFEIETQRGTGGSAAAKRVKRPEEYSKGGFLDDDD